MFQRELRQLWLIEKGVFFRTRPKNCMVTKRQMDLWLGRVKVNFMLILAVVLFFYDE